MIERRENIKRLKETEKNNYRYQRTQVNSSHFSSVVSITKISSVTGPTVLDFSSSVF